MKLKNILKGSIKNLDTWQIRYIRKVYLHKPCILCKRCKVYDSIAVPDDAVCSIYHNGRIIHKIIEPLETCFRWIPDKKFIRKYPRMDYANKSPYYNNNAAGGR